MLTAQNICIHQFVTLHLLKLMYLPTEKNKIDSLTVLIYTHESHATADND